MRIKELFEYHGWNLLPKGSEILTKIAYNNDIDDEPKPKKKKVGKRKSRAGDEIVATWWPHQRKDFPPEWKEWLENDKKYKNNIAVLRKKFIARRKEATKHPEEWANKTLKGKTHRHGAESFRRQASKILTNALKRAPEKSALKSLPQKSKANPLSRGRGLRPNLEMPN